MMALALAVYKRPIAPTRAISRIAACGGLETVAAAAPAELERAVVEDNVRLICASDDALAEVLPLAGQFDGLKILVLATSGGAPLLEACRRHQIDHVFGLRYSGGLPRSWELLSVLRRYASRDRAPLESYLDWGCTWFEREPSTSQDRDAIVSEVGHFVGKLLGRRLAPMCTEVAHELLMNAMYDAPADGEGRPLFAYDRTASIELAPEQRPQFACGCDGSRLLMSVTDPFGRLERSHVFDGLCRTMASGTINESGGGAGLGFTVIYNATTLMMFDVTRHARTRMTAILDLDMPLRELRTLPRSIHFFADG